MKRIIRRPIRQLALIASTVWLGASLVASPATATETAEQRGAALLTAIDTGQRDCQDLTSADFEAIGEFAMGRMLGSPQAHESMDQLAIQMMGTSGLDRVHQVMGQRFAARGQPAFPGGFTQMMALMPGMGGGIGPQGAGPMMGGQGYGPGDQGVGSDTVGPGSSMGFGRDSGDNNGQTAWMVVAMVVLILGAAGLVFFLVRPRSQRSVALVGGAFEVLARRFAAGEISVEEFDQRRRLLEGGRG